MFHLRFYSFIVGDRNSSDSLATGISSFAWLDKLKDFGHVQCCDAENKRAA